jgi:hypothetical protein
MPAWRVEPHGSFDLGERKDDWFEGGKEHRAWEG